MVLLIKKLYWVIVPSVLHSLQSSLHGTRYQSQYYGYRYQTGTVLPLILKHLGTACRKVIILSKWGAQRTSAGTMIATSNPTIARMTDPANIHGIVTLTDDDLGYEECAPTIRRGSMSMDEEKERRASIKAVMADPNLSPITKRRSIQHLMDGRRSSLADGDSPCNLLKKSDGDKECGGIDDNDKSNAALKLDARRTFNPHCTSIVPTCNDQTKRAEEMRPHCPHYERNCTLIAPCCGAAFGCRICHDDSPVLYV
jgi:hypothetical protein